MDPRVSVFLFCKDRAQTIRRSVGSVLAQTHTNIEYVIQDGASTDGTLEILREYDDPRIELRSEQDSGPEEGFWRAIRRCRGDYVCACLSDEELSPTAVADAVAELETQGDAVALVRDAHLTDIDGRVLGTALGRDFDVVDYMANRFAPNFAAAMFRRTALDAIGLQTREWDQQCGEFELWCRLGLLGPIRYLPGIVAKYAHHDAQLSRNAANAARIAQGRARVIRALAAETGLFDKQPDLLNACLTASGLTFARHLLSLGADRLAVEAYVGLAEESGRLPIPTRQESASERYLSAARGQRLGGNDRRALAILEVARLFKPTDARFSWEIGKTLAAAGRVDRALAMLDDAVSIDPGLQEAHWERGVLLERRGRIDEALDAWRRADVTNDPHRHSLYLVASLKSPTATNQSLFTAHREWAGHHAVPTMSLQSHRFPARHPDDRIVVGYACSFWDSDTISFQLLPMLRRHDRRRFKVIAYAQTEPGPLVKQAADEVRVVGHLSNDDYVRQVREDGVRILVELNGHSPGHWFAAMASRCAPIQVSYLNYTSTSGVDEVDYVLGDAISIPEGTDRCFTEEVYRLPGCFFCFTYEDAPLPPVGDPPSVASGTVTFGCFGSGGKINPSLIDLWSVILLRVPHSRLCIRNAELNPADNRRALERAFEERGIACSRLLILPGTTRQGILESYGAVDISLDTFPYCGGNTIAESLWQGVPVVTLQGDRFSSAYGASLLTASGLPELVARTPEEYVEKCVELAGDSGRLAFYRANLRTMVKQFGFSDADRFTKTLEAAYLEMTARTRDAIHPHFYPERDESSAKANVA